MCRTVHAEVLIKVRGLFMLVRASSTTNFLSYSAMKENLMPCFRIQNELLAEVREGTVFTFMCSNTHHVWVVSTSCCCFSLPLKSQVLVTGRDRKTNYTSRTELQAIWSYFCPGKALALFCTVFWKWKWGTIPLLDKNWSVGATFVSRVITLASLGPLKEACFSTPPTKWSQEFKS